MTHVRWSVVSLVIVSHLLDVTRLMQKNVLNFVNIDGHACILKGARRICDFD